MRKQTTSHRNAGAVLAPILALGLLLASAPFAAAGVAPAGVAPAVSDETEVDAVVAAPEHYSIVAENEQVRVLRIRYAPGESSAMHHHPEAVAVFLTDHLGRLEAPDGTFQDVAAKAGDAIVTPPGSHRGSNIGDAPYELLLVELKETARRVGAAAGASAGTMGPDPTVEDPDHYGVLFENDRVRTLRIGYGPGETSVMHDHPEAVAVFLTDHVGELELPDGTIEPVVGRAGDVLITPAGQHRPTNTGDAAYELVLIELK